MASADAGQYDGASTTVAAVVVTYNRRELLRQCLEALQSQTHPVTEIVVVDNASTDGTAETVRADFPDVTLRVLDENRGGAGGFHEGMKLAASRDVDWIWVMDDDVEPTSESLGTLFETGLHMDEETAGLATNNVFADGTPQSGHTGSYDRARMKIRSPRGEGQAVVPIEYSSFAGLLIRADAIETIGAPDPDYFIWGDDIEYSQRLSNFGQLYLVRESRTIHHETFANDRKRVGLLSAAWRDRPLSEYWRTYYAHRNRLLTLRRHAESYSEFLFGCLNGVWRLFLGMCAISLIDRCKKLRFRMLWKAFIHGVMGKGGKYISPDSWPPTEYE